MDAVSNARTYLIVAFTCACVVILEQAISSTMRWIKGLDGKIGVPIAVEYPFLSFTDYFCFHTPLSLDTLSIQNWSSPTKKENWTAELYRDIYLAKCHSSSPFRLICHRGRHKIFLSIPGSSGSKEIASSYNRVELKSLPPQSWLLVYSRRGFAGQTVGPIPLSPMDHHFRRVSLRRIKVNFNQISDRMKSQVSPTPRSFVLS